MGKRHIETQYQTEADTQTDVGDHTRRETKPMYRVMVLQLNTKQID